MNKWVKIYTNLTKEELLIQLKNLVLAQTQFTITGVDKNNSNTIYMIPSSQILNMPKETLENSFSSYTIWQQVKEN